MALASSLPAPTKAERLRMDLIVQAGCICCWAAGQIFTACEVHHLTEGGKHGAPRLGHAYTIGLCPWHHRGVGVARAWTHLGPSYAREPVWFRERFGGDAALLRLQADLLADLAASFVIHPGKYACPTSLPASKTTGFA